MLGRWFQVRSESGMEHAQNLCKNPHYAALALSLEKCNGQPDSNFLYFLHPDHLGSSSYVTDGSGAVYEHAQYFPSGELWVSEHSNTQRNPYLFSGKEYEEETGLYDFGARYYDPRTSLWLSVDPAELEYIGGAGLGGMYNPVQLNGYVYAAANPVKHVDPDGRMPNILAGAIAGALIGAGIELGRQVFAREQMSWDNGRRVLAAAAGGAAMGAIAGATMGASLAVEIGGAALAGAEGGVITRAVNGQGTTVSQVAQDAACGVAGLGAGKLLGAGVRALSPAKPAIMAESALTAGRQIEAAWGASNYRHGGLLTGMEHIMYRHSANSGFANVSRYAQGTTARDIVGYVDDALRLGEVTPTGKTSFTVEHSLGKTIGKNIAGEAASSIRVFVRDGIIQTAFPF
jgi:RHS repeat-associated protein